MSLPQNKKNSPGRLNSLAIIVAVLFTFILVVIQFQVSSSYEHLAKRVGVFDSQSKTVNMVYLDYEEQAAILRSSGFLVAEKSQGYVTAPSKVIYLEPFSVLNNRVSQSNAKQ